MIERVISGGQTSADQPGLRAASADYIATSEWHLRMVDRSWPRPPGSANAPKVTAKPIDIERGGADA